MGGSERTLAGWRQLFNAIAVPSTDALKKSSWYRIRVTRSARSAGLRWSLGRKTPTSHNTNLSNIQPESRNDYPGAEEPSSATADVLVPDRFPLICCFRIADGLNTITRRGEIGTSVPVCGLRPIRCFFLRTKNDPNDESLTVSPLSKLAVISFKTSSTMARDWKRDSPAFW
jgi:hypothetical protein